jgi:hypothetical protein
MTRKEARNKVKSDRLNSRSSFFKLNTLDYGNVRGKMSKKKKAVKRYKKNIIVLQRR